MIWTSLRRPFGRLVGGAADAIQRQASQQQHGDGPTDDPKFVWLSATDNPWNVPVLDVRPITLTMISTSGDPSCARNAISFLRDDGRDFIDKEPQIDRTVATSLKYPIDRLLADGVIFRPTEMEQ